MKIVTSSEMYAIEEKCEISGLISRFKMMDNAGREIAEQTVRMFPDIGKKKVLIICGKGNNGGDGLVAARYFSRLGVKTQIIILSDRKNLSVLSKKNLSLLSGKKGIKILEVRNSTEMPGNLKSFDTIIDAILGTGFSGEVRGLYKQAIEQINSSEAFKISVDIPSGLDSDSGRAKLCVMADRTFTLGAPKQGLFFLKGIEASGKVEVLDIGINKCIPKDVKLDLVTRNDIHHFSERKIDSHKGLYGNVLIIAGSPGFTGAAALAGNGALYSGSGLITVGVPKSISKIMALKFTEVMAKPLAETKTGSFSLKAYNEIMGIKKKIDAVAIGPGISRQPETLNFARKIIQNIKAPLVVDADSIFALKGHTGILNKRKSLTVLTPHTGEMSFLTGLSVKEINSDRLNIAKNFSKERNVALVLKGARTIIAFPDGKTWINQTGNAGMAKGGSGDVLTGMIVSFIGQKIEFGLAIRTAVYLHGLAGDLAKTEKGEISMTPTDLIKRLPEAFRMNQGKEMLTR